MLLLLPAPFEQFMLCLAVVALATGLPCFLLPRPLFCKVFKIAFPFLRRRDRG